MTDESNNAMAITAPDEVFGGQAVKPQGTDQIAKALAAAQAEMQPAKKDAENPFFKSTYADLASVIKAVQPLGTHGIAWTQRVKTELKSEINHERKTLDDFIWVGCRTDLYHTSGQSLIGDWLYLPVKEATAQAVGSAITYAKRYSLAATCGVATEDDDGEAAEGRPTQGKSSWTQVAEGQQVPGAETILDVVESKAGGSWGIKTNGGTYITKDETVADQLSECRDKGIEAVITATEQKVGSKTVRVVMGVQEQVF